MKLLSITLLLVTLFYLVQTAEMTSEQLIKEMEDWNAWAKENQNNKKYKAKKYKPKVQSLGSEEQVGGIEAMRFLHMYRSNHKGEIADKIDLFKEFFNGKEEIKKDVFYRLAAVWLKRQHFEMVTGTSYIEQEHIYKKYERQNARRFANDEINELPINQLHYEFDLLFSDKDQFTLIDAAHWLVDTNLYGKIGQNRLDDIFEDVLNREATRVEELAEIEGRHGIRTEDQIPNEEIDKIDL